MEEAIKEATVLTGTTGHVHIIASKHLLIISIVKSI